MAKEQSLELAAATAFRAAATAHRATADAFDAFAVTYERVASGDVAGTEPAAKPAAGKPKPTPATDAPKAKPVSHADAKTALMKLVDLDGKDRTRVDAILVKHAGAVMKVDNVSADKLAGILADAEAAIASGPAAKADDI